MGILIGEIVMRLNGNPQYSPPFPRGGQGFQANLDSLDVPSNGAQLNVEVELKDNSATLWGSLGTFALIVSTGIKTFTATGCKENLRFKMWITGGVGPLPSDAFLFNMLSPNWTP